ncbi:NAD(P)-dependent oxidoreductase [Skermania piniformis]|uniref:SDR family oxidoreductase n=1 Tax=Skermania pinensis TaxID=39122 RepID=A0ABX8S4M9_9ACTN|nr:NAD(P)-binding oxidoreductase [Skermania piniformis]QXQ12790.1 SDR family oxidoreductase [Skermania piniformis]
MNVLVIGATGGSGRAVVAELLARGHRVTAFSRHASGLATAPQLRAVDGDATDPAAVDAVVPGHDAVVIALGISENPLRVRLRGPAGTAADVRSAGTRHVIAAMQRNGIHRLVVQSTYGVGATAGRLGVVDRLFFAVLIKGQAADHERQEQLVRASGLDWVIVQPIHLHDSRVGAGAFVSETGEVVGRKVSRGQVATVLADAAESVAGPVHRSLAVSARA